MRRSIIDVEWFAESVLVDGASSVGLMSTWDEYDTPLVFVFRPNGASHSPSQGRLGPGKNRPQKFLEAQRAGNSPNGIRLKTNNGEYADVVTSDRTVGPLGRKRVLFGSVTRAEGPWLGELLAHSGRKTGVIGNEDHWVMCRTVGSLGRTRRFFVFRPNGASRSSSQGRLGPGKFTAHCFS